MIQTVRFHLYYSQSGLNPYKSLRCDENLFRKMQHLVTYCKSMCYSQGLRASSLQFTSPLEFNAIFRDGFRLRLKLNG